MRLRLMLIITTGIGTLIVLASLVFAYYRSAS
jgi:hypothetical protein